MDQIRIAADSSCDLLTMDGVDFVSVPSVSYTHLTLPTNREV